MLGKLRQKVNGDCDCSGQRAMKRKLRRKSGNTMEIATNLGKEIATNPRGLSWKKGIATERSGIKNDVWKLRRTPERVTKNKWKLRQSAPVLRKLRRQDGRLNFAIWEIATNTRNRYE